MSNAFIPVPDWFAQEIRETWIEARKADGQKTAFQVFERRFEKLNSQASPPWALQEVQETWRVAQEVPQWEGFHMLERMVDRLGYGRLGDPPIKPV